MPRLCWSPITTNNTTTTVTDNENVPSFDDIVEETPSVVTPTHVAPPDRTTEGFETNPPIHGAETAVRGAVVAEEDGGDEGVRVAAVVEPLDRRMASHMAVLDGRLAQLERLTGLRAAALPSEAENTPLPVSPTVADLKRKTTNEPRRAMTEVTNKTNIDAFDAKTRSNTEKNVNDKEGDATVTTKEAAVSSASSSSSSSSSSWSKSGASSSSSSSSSSWSKSSSSSSSSSSWSKSSASPAAIPKHVTLTATASADHNERLLVTVASLTSAIESLDRRMGDHMSILDGRLTRLERHTMGAGGVAAVGIRATVVGSGGAGGGGDGGDPEIRATVVGEEEDIVVDAWADDGVRAEVV